MRTQQTPRQKYILELSQRALAGHPQAAALQFAQSTASALRAGMAISEHEGQLIRSLLKPLRLSSFVEVGTFTGFSALWILEALGAQGVLWTYELDPKHFEAAKQTFSKAGELVIDNGDQVDFVIDRKRIIMTLGDAREKLQTLKSPIDGIFIDANKAAYGDYLTWAEQTMPKGGVVIADNVFLFGAVYGEGEMSEKQIQVMRDLNTRLTDPNLYCGQILPTEEGILFSTKLF
jgi:predicted O-methyltransferase YrrM